MLRAAVVGGCALLGLATVGVINLSRLEAKLPAGTLPGFVAAIAPDSSALLMRQNRAVRYVSPAEQPGEQIIDTAQASLAKAPLESEPLLDLGLQAYYGVFDVSRTQRLLEQARLRDQRNELAVAILHDLAYRNGDYTRSIALLDQLIRTDRRNMDRYFTALTTMAQTPEGRRAVFEYMAQEPDWMARYVNNMAQSAPDDRYTEMLVNAYIDRHGYNDDTKLPANILLMRYVRQGSPDTALRFYHNLGEPGRQPGQTVVDPQFRGIMAPTPFNWSLARSEFGLSEFMGNGGLYVSFAGRQRATLVQQTLMLMPGRHYRLTNTLERRPDRVSGAHRWSLVCQESRAELTTLDVFSDGGQSEAFTVPASGCQFQRLMLIGEPSEYVHRVDYVISSLDVVPAEGS